MDGVALVAVGGYGRAELSPQSDIDLLLLHDGRPDIATIAERVWYPIWDEGLKLGHSVRTTKEALALGGRRSRHCHVAAVGSARRWRRDLGGRPGDEGTRLVAEAGQALARRAQPTRA